MINVDQKKPAPHKIQKEDFAFTVMISPDEMSAHLTIEQTSEDAAFDFSKEALIEIISQAGVVYGMNEGRLEKLATELMLNKPIEIARGKSPERGQDSGFELLFAVAGSKAPVIGEDGYIDYKNLNLINNATVGQPLAKRIAATVGEPGKSVTGKEIPGIEGKDRALPKGKNTEISSDNADLLVATREGAITFANNLVSIDNVYKLKDDVGTATGNIDFVGSLLISGDVTSGFKVKAAGNIEIGKNIEDAEVISGGSVVAKGGFVGSGKGVILAKEDVFVKYVENQQIEAGHDVNIGGGAMNASIVAGNAVYQKGLKAVIVGGSVTAHNLIETNTIGSEMGTPTLVRVGYSPAIMRAIQELEAKLKQLEKDESKIKQALYSLVRLELDNRLSPKQKEALEQLRAHSLEIPNLRQSYEDQKQEFLGKLRENKTAKIIVKGHVYPGAIIQVGLLKKEINKLIGSCSFGVTRDQIVIISRT